MRYSVIHRNIIISNTNNIASARARANGLASSFKGDIVHIYYRGEDVERFHVGPIGKMHWQLNDFVTNTINLPTLDGGSQMAQNISDNLKRREKYGSPINEDL